VPALPDRVKVEPVAEFPHVSHHQDPLGRGRRALDEILELTFLLDTGLILFGPDLPTSRRHDSKGEIGGSGPSFGSDVHLRVEKLGMVVEVLTAKTAKALDDYLARKQFRMSASSIAGLAPYLGKEYTLICGWTARPEKGMEARALRIDFRTPHVFYPLRPTQVYQTRVATDINIRGWFHPRDARTFRGTWRPLMGKVTQAPDSVPQDAAEPFEPVTIIRLAEDPRDWTEDLFFEEGAPEATSIAHCTAEFYSRGAWVLWSGLLGIVLAIWLPWILIPATLRRRTDCLWAAGVGAALIVSVYVAAFVLVFWGRSRYPRVPIRPLRLLARCVLACVVLPILVLGAGFIWEVWWVGYRLLGQITVVSAIAVAVGFILSGYSGPGARWGWLALLVTLHLAVTTAMCVGLRDWLNGNYNRHWVTPWAKPFAHPVPDRFRPSGSVWNWP
jgi:hypothetical protein